MARIAEGVLLAVVVVIIAALFYDPGNTTEGFAREIIAPRGAESNSIFTKSYEYFDSQGSQIEALLYIPKNSDNPPIVILAHGIGLQKHHGLEKVAEAFVKKGLAVLLFDYRHFGGSEGEPRHLIKVNKQISDYHAAIRHVSTLKGVNGNKIGLWGTSFSGGHVLSVTSEQISLRKNSNITCVVARVPYLDSLDALTYLDYTVAFQLKSVAVAIKDLIISFFGKQHYIPLVGTGPAPSILVVEDIPKALSTVGAKEGVNGWYNMVPARTILELALYRPHLQASGVTVPTLILYAAKDEFVSPAQVEKTAALIPHVTLEKVDAKHMEVYLRDDVIETEAKFLAKHLL